MAGWTRLRQGHFNYLEMKKLCTGRRGGPLYIFNNDQFRGNSENSTSDGLNDQMFIISSFSNFMDHNFEQFSSARGPNPSNQHELQVGIMSNITEIPKNYEISTIVSVSGKINNDINDYRYDTVTAGIKKWASVLRTQYSQYQKIQDDISSKIAYYMDRGSYYYYHNIEDKCTSNDCNYENTIKELLRTNFKKVPYQSIQYDSWFYTKSAASEGINPRLGVANWTARDDVFPNGAEALYDLHKLPVTAHNRVWASNNIYRDEYEFVCDDKEDTNYCVPNEGKFWDQLFSEGQKWGLKVYEQDWMSEQYLHTSELTSELGAAKTWLSLMAKSAESLNLNIQYCMAMPRMMLQSLEFPSVTQIRVSDDYLPGYGHRGQIDNTVQWDIGFVSMIAFEFGLSPFKDVFWSSKYQCDRNDTCPYPENDISAFWINDNRRPGDQVVAYEPFPLRQLVVSVLSTGLVAAGDRIGDSFQNAELLNKACNSDGLILKPDYPLIPTDFEISGFTKGIFNFDRKFNKFNFFQRSTG